MVEDAVRDGRGADHWRLVRRAAAVAYFLTLAGIVVAYRVPTGRLHLAIIIVVGLAISCIGRSWSSLTRVFLDWLPFTLVLMAYDTTRGLADLVGMPLQEADIVDAERWLFGGVVPTVWLQDHLYSPTSVHWYDALMTLVYTSHFLATPILAAVLWLRERKVWLGFAIRVVIVSVAGLVTYVLFPEAPPWLAARDHLIDPVARLSARGWIWLHASNVQDLLANAQRDGSNPVAAMPSLHVAFATMVALFIASRVRSRWRWLLVLYPVSMGFALVYLGEHYVLDLAAGVLYAVAVHLAVGRWERARAMGRAPGELAVDAVSVR